MRTKLRLIFGILAFLLGFSSLQAAASSAPSTAQQDAVKKKLSGMQIPFIENKGQVDKSVAFYAPTFAGTVFVTKKGELVYALPANNTDEDGTSSSVQVLTERLVAGKPVPAPLTAAATQVSYFLGNDKTKWQRTVSTQSAISLGEVWKGIDVELHAHGNNVEKFFTVRPGASVDMIQVQLDGAKSLKISQDGALDVATESGTVRFTPPVAWQEKEGKKLPVQVAYAAKGNTYGFTLGKHDASLPVIIDPLLQSTYLGGNDGDRVEGIAIHPLTGDVYVTGFTYSFDFPGTEGGAQTTLEGADGTGISDGFVAQLNSSLTKIIQASFLGGSTSTGYGNSIAIDPVSGDVYLTGTTSSTDFPGVTGGAQAIYASGGSDVFVTRMNSSLTTIIQSTYLGGSRGDYSPVIAIHPYSGDVYVAGDTNSTNFPGTAGGAQAAWGGGANNDVNDVFVSRLNSGLTSLIQSTYLGGSKNEYGPRIAFHPLTGDVYVAGITKSTDFPQITGGAQTAKGKDFDAFITRLNSTLTSIVQSTYVGGNSFDYAPSIAIHPITHEVYIAGQTYSTNFPGVNGGAQAQMGGVSDAYVSRLDGNLTRILQSTYLGGSEDEPGPSLVLHPTTGDVYVTGQTNSTDFPGTSGGAQAIYGGSADMSVSRSDDLFVSRLNANLTTLKQSTYLGGSGYEAFSRIAIHPLTGDVYQVGDTHSIDIPGTTGGAQVLLDDNGSSFISRLTQGLALIEDTLTLSAAVSGSGTGVVTSSDGLIQCGGDCSETYASTQAVTLSATPAADSSFTGWSGACSNVSGDCVVTMDTSKQVTANFFNGYLLSVSKTGTGSGSITEGVFPDYRINCETDCEEYYPANTLVTLNATALSGSKFSNWSSACGGNGTAPTCTVTMDAAKSVSAKFNLTGYTLTINNRGTGSGTVTSTDGLINCGADCRENYAANTVVTLNATPSAGSTFAGWTNACSGTASCTVTMSAAKDVRATFNLQAVQ